MNWIKNLTAIVVLPFFICCTTENGRGQQMMNKQADQKSHRSLSEKPLTSLSDEQEFRRVLESLKQNLRKKSLKNVSALLNYPFYTSHKQASNGIGIPDDPINLSEFNTYKSAIFNTDVMRILPLCKEDNLSEIDDKTDEVYYRSLKKITDAGSKMYEVYMQYPERGTQAESYFSFIFGKVNGKFKMLATYAKWPVK
ncbi:hypothetical protein [Pedobacter sp. AJM]|uniref:hypothetical protein n=1 Tax=Pedobacter sp. AJM TaxID=2003629 RepID=UPI000B4AA68D|nr:hypothetical protein [Pedobacter sp. AJM]OWK72597.1 hypothetical protein CBW18_03310 [Pedobacter sp. AJM]